MINLNMSSGQTNNKGFFKNLQRIIGEKVDMEEGVFNEASFEIVHSHRNTRDVNDIVNQTAPAYQSVKHNQNKQQNFDFGDEIEDQVFENESMPKPSFLKKYQETKEVLSQKQLPQPQVISHPIEGFDEIIVKKLLNQNFQQEQLDKMVIHKKGELLSLDQGLFQIKKNPKKFHTIFEFITGEKQKTTRYIFLENGYVYMLKNTERNQYQVCSASKLDQLFKIFAKSHQKKPLIKLAFFNDKMSIYLLPKVKSFTLFSLEQQNKFFMKLRTDLQKFGKDLQFMKK